jgi:hypothetical protein
MINTTAIILIVLNGYGVNISNIYKLEPSIDDTACLVSQKSSPPEIYVRRTCESIREEIIDRLVEVQ